MLTVATLLWDPNEHSFDFSTCYNETWVDKLYRGFARNLTVPFQFRVFTERLRGFEEPAIGQSILQAAKPSYRTCIEPYRLDQPMILCGLDTVVLRNVDHLANYCLTAEMIALPRDPFFPEKECNGVALVPAGHDHVFYRHNGENDMDWMNAQPHEIIDDLFPGSVKSYKGHVLGQSHQGGRRNPKGIDGVDIVFLHGRPKQHELPHEEFVRRHWI